MQSLGSLSKVIQNAPQSILYIALQIAAALAVLSEPFLPFNLEKIEAILRTRPLSKSIELGTNR